VLAVTSFWAHKEIRNEAVQPVEDFTTPEVVVEDVVVVDDEDDEDADVSEENTNGPKTRVHTVKKTRNHSTHTVKKTRTHTRTKKTKTSTATPTSTVVPTTTFVPTSTAVPTTTTGVVPTTKSTTTTVVVPTTTTVVVPTTTTTTVVVPTTTTTTVVVSSTTSTVVVPTTTTSTVVVPTTTTTTVVVPTTTTTTVVVPTTTVVTTTVAPTTSAVPTTTSVPVPSGAPSYFVVPINQESILGGQKLVENPALSDASPKGWEDKDAASGEFLTTGNNVAASRIGLIGKSRNGKFDYKFDTTQDPSTAENIGAATANVFYVSNAYHDTTYRYGFDEKSSNFQKDNVGRGGLGNDAVQAAVQSADGTNNANFATPPDGTPGRMRMYIFTLTTPKRDGDVDNGVIEHELTHGLSNRLTGGNGNANCLGTTQSRGMGEGWSDTFAWWATMKASDTRATDRTTGSYVINKPEGIRQYPYSTSVTTNKHKYSDLAVTSEVHDVGEIWSTMLYEVYWNMVDKAGFNPDINDSTSDKGNVRFMKNFVDGLKLQPCNPSFLTARDAIIKADKANNGGKFVCDIWKGFAKRGMGANAANNVDNFDLGDGCA
ncbi:hypothetical protein HDU97_008324, partial [Phlyctochytrium planicorne]